MTECACVVAAAAAAAHPSRVASFSVSVLIEFGKIFRGSVSGRDVRRQFGPRQHFGRAKKKKSRRASGTGRKVPFPVGLLLPGGLLRYLADIVITVVVRRAASPRRAAALAGRRLHHHPLPSPQGCFAGRHVRPQGCFSPGGCCSSWPSSSLPPPSPPHVELLLPGGLLR